MVVWQWGGVLAFFQGFFGLGLFSPITVTCLTTAYVMVRENRHVVERGQVAAECGRLPFFIIKGVFIRI